MREAVHLLTKQLQVLSTIACMECQFTVWSNICTIYLLVAFMMINIGSKPVRRSEHKTSLSPSASNAFVCHGSSVSGSRKFCNSEARNLKCIKRRENPRHGHNIERASLNSPAFLHDQLQSFTMIRLYLQPMYYYKQI